MAVIRAAGTADLAALTDLLDRAGSALAGLTNLVGDRARVASMLEDSEAAFSTQLDEPGGESYLFVLELADGTLAGTSGLISAVGLADVFYSYRLGTVVKASPRHGVHNVLPVLRLSNDYTGAAELCRLYLDGAHRGGGSGRLLSVSRLLFISEHRERVARRLMAELRGSLRADGTSPFWEGLASRFLGMSFAEADELSGSGDKAFIAELMPAEAIYVSLLLPETQEAIGVTHPETAPARALLEAEGLRYRGYIDIFDGGPALEAEVEDLRAVREGRIGRVVIDDAPDDADGDGGHAIVTNRLLAGFRAVATTIGVDDDEVRLTTAAVELLQVQPGEEVRYLLNRPGSGASAQSIDRP